MALATRDLHGRKRWTRRCLLRAFTLFSSHIARQLHNTDVSLASGRVLDRRFVVFVFKEWAMRCRIAAEGFVRRQFGVIKMGNNSHRRRISSVFDNWAFQTETQNNRKKK
eukprot:3453949-Rhodomonas_salina.1